MASLKYEIRDLTAGKVLARQHQAFGQKIFMTELRTGRTVTYGALDEKSNQVANALQSRGVDHGIHVAMVMDNSLEFLDMFFGIAKLGAVCVPINTAARGSSLAYFINQSDANAVVVDQQLLPRIVEVLGQLTKVEQLIVVEQFDAPNFPDTTLLNRPAVGYRTFVNGLPTSAPQADVVCSDLMLLAYTSGTSGPSKGCMVSHAAAFSFGTSFIDIHGYSEDDVFYVCLPLFHNNALLAATGSAILAGASVALTRRFSVSRFWDDLRQAGATVTNLLGSMSSFVWSQPPDQNDRNNPLRLVSMSPTPKWAAAFQERFDAKVMSNYGLSDFGMATAFTKDFPTEKLGSIGKLRPGIQMRIVDDFDFEVSPGTVGEIVLRHDEPWRASTGYYNMPEVTARANRNLWFHTGDRAYIDADGFYYFVDRKKDCIRRRGENISSFEVEQTIMGHTAVADVAVFPIKIEGNDEEVGAVIVLKPDAPATEADIVRHCEKNMAYFMVPRYIQFRQEMPLTSNNKIEKFKLQQDAEQQLPLFWDRAQSGLELTR